MAGEIKEWRWQQPEVGTPANPEATTRSVASAGKTGSFRRSRRTYICVETCQRAWRTAMWQLLHNV